MPNARDLVARNRNLASLPAVYLRIRELLDDPASSMLDYARVAQSDPALAARVLRVANSAFFGVSRKVETLSLALSLMGVSRLHDLALATSVIHALGQLPANRINIEHFWRRSIHSGILARLLAVEAGIFDNERLFVAGLLHEVGHLIMSANLPEETRNAVRVSREQGEPLHRVEREALGFHYGDAGAELMTLWTFPDSLRDVCRFHPEPSGSRQFARECALVQLSRITALGSVRDQEDTPFVDSPGDPLIQLCGIDAQQLAAAARSADQHVAEVVEMLMPSPSA